MDLEDRMYTLLLSVATPKKKKTTSHLVHLVTSAKYLIGWQEFFIIRTDEKQRKPFKTDFLAEPDI